MPRESLKQRKDNRFRARYHGKEFYGTTQTEAYKKRDEYKDLVKQGLRTEEVTVREYSAKWLPTHRSDVKKRTYNTYAHYIDVANEVIGDIPLINVTPSDIRSVYNVYASKSQSSIDKIAVLMNSMFESAFHDRYVRVNPCAEVDKPKGTAGTHRSLTPEEDELILTVDHKLKPLVLIMRYAGLRRGEVLALLYEDIDFKNNIIHVTKAVSFDIDKPIIGLPKTEAGVRDIPLFSVLKKQIEGNKGAIIKKDTSQTSFKRAWEAYINAVEKHMNGCQKRWYGRRRIDKETNPKKYQKVVSLEADAKKAQMFGKANKAKELLEEAEKIRLEGWKDFTIRTHDLRHSYVSMLCDANVEKDLAMKWVGHADEKMINRIYDHVSEYRKEKATQDVENMLTAKKSENLP